MNKTLFFEKAIPFLQGIGIPVMQGSLLAADCFLPGFMIDRGVIIIDHDQMKYPGDLLHEAAHIAVVPAAERNQLNGKDIAERKDAASEEMMAIAWSYAACRHLNIDPMIVFHDDGYKGGGTSIVESFDNGNYFGVPVLQWLGMTTTVPSEDEPLVYPYMKKWLRN